MKRQQQLALPLEISEELMRKAHEKCRVTTAFDEAMKLQHFRISLGRVAMQIAAHMKKKKRNAAH